MKRVMQDATYTLYPLQILLKEYKQSLLDTLSVNPQLVQAHLLVERFYFCRDLAWQEMILDSNSPGELGRYVRKQFDCVWIEQNLQKKMFWETVPRVVCKFVSDDQFER